MRDRLAAGKVPWDLIADLVGGKLPSEVRLGPACGEDAALVELGGELWAFASDPITFTSEQAGRLAVEVNANDVAVRGARPRFFLAVVLLAPSEAEPERVRELLGQVRAACDRLGVTLIGGHTEVAPGLAHSVVVGTMLGRVLGRPITTGGLRPGDLVGMTRTAGLEGTAILLRDLSERLRTLHGPDFGRELGPRLGAGSLLVVEEALAAAALPAVSALHDVTEGGVGEAIHELGRAAGLEVEVTRDDVPVLEETRAICADLGLDPLGLIGSGALLVGCGEESRNELEAAMARLGTPFTWIGRAVEAGGAPSRVPRFARDELLRVSLLDGVRAVVFDLDGTLVDSRYDWPAIRQELGLFSPSLIDELNALPGQERETKWSRLRAIERTATEGAVLREGARELLELLQGLGMRTALVTNNSEANALFLLDRFGLRFDLLLTRDSGFWKPSGAPLAKAITRLGVEPEQCLTVGDSPQDLAAGRAVGCRVCIVYGGAKRCGSEADLSFPGLLALIRYLRLVR